MEVRRSTGGVLQLFLVLLSTALACPRFSEYVLARPKSARAMSEAHAKTTA